MSLLEAGALGKAVISSQLGGISEIIEDGKNGLLVAPGIVEDLRKKILQLWNDDVLCKRMGEQARELVEKKNSSEEHYQKIMGLYNGLLTSTH
jgi:glycosyltransferase involved in cell wall biosynthesis